jgi:hypothetical protein
MIKESITPQDVCDLLNGFLELDKDCAQKLLSRFESCNKEVEDHETIQVDCSEPKNSKVRFLGLLNGMFGKDSYGDGPIVCVMDDDDNIVHFFVEGNQ